MNNPKNLFSTLENIIIENRVALIAKRVDEVWSWLERE
jgi:hypothetical protein